MCKGVSFQEIRRRQDRRMCSCRRLGPLKDPVGHRALRRTRTGHSLRFNLVAQTGNDSTVNRVTCLRLDDDVKCISVCCGYLRAARSEPGSSRGAGVPAWARCSAGTTPPRRAPAPRGLPRWTWRGPNLRVVEAGVGGIGGC